jgi:hypothetical protein
VHKKGEEGHTTHLQRLSGALHPMELQAMSGVVALVRAELGPVLLASGVQCTVLLRGPYSAQTMSLAKQQRGFGVVPVVQG